MISHCIGRSETPRLFGKDPIMSIWSNKKLRVELQLRNFIMIVGDSFQNRRI